MQLSLTAAERSTLSAAMARRPRDELAALIKAFGDPRPKKGKAVLYGADALWARANVVGVEMPFSVSGMRGGHTVDVHRIMGPALLIAMRQVQAFGLTKAFHTWNGSWVYRYILGTNTLSTHALAVGFDMNAATNRQGTPGDLHPRVVEIFEQCGFVWGGRWSPGRQDPMHFQWTLPEYGTTVPAWQDAAVKAPAKPVVTPKPVAASAGEVVRIFGPDGQLIGTGTHVAGTDKVYVKAHL